MTKVEFSDDMLADIDRLVNFLIEYDVFAALNTFDIINDGLQLLKRHPEVGRVVDGGKRELVISRGNTGYIAIYSFDQLQNVVVVLAVKHQREADYG